MDQAILIYILLAVVIILPIVGIFLKRKARRAGAQHRASTQASKQDRNASDTGLGATLTFDADEATVRSFTAPILESAKRVRLEADGTWAQTHYNDDDVVYALAPAPGGTVLGVSRAIEFAGTLNGMKAWQKLREQLVAAATERGITTSTGSRPLVRTAETSESGAVIWRPAN